MAAASLALSIVALLISMVGLGWTIYEWHRSGARLKVKSTSFYTFGPLGEATFIAVDVTNTGRTATTVTTVGFDRGKGKGIFVNPDPAIGNARTPVRLEPGESFTYPTSIESLLSECTRLGDDPFKLRPFANSGHGRFLGEHDASARKVLADGIGS